MLQKKLLQFGLIAAVAMTSCKKKTTDDDDSGNNNNNVVDPCTQTINKTNGPVAGTMYILATDTAFAGDTNLYAATGANSTWNFGTLANDKQDTFNFAAPATQLLASKFPSANFIVTEGNNSLAAAGTDSGIVILGAQIPPILKNITLFPAFANPATFIPYTLEMNKSQSDGYKASAQIPFDTIITVGFFTLHFDSVRATFSGSNVFSINGCGKITTPSGTYDCLKYKLTPGTMTVKYEGHLYGGAWGDYTSYANLLGIQTPKIPLINTTGYVWVSKEKGFPVCMVTYDSNGKATVEYLK